MRLQICHLSDIHFLRKNNFIENKKNKLCDAIISKAYREEDILFLVSGDIAQSGATEEYDIAKAFFTFIKDELYKQKEIRSYFVFAPGNHDAILNEDDFDEENRRKEVLLNKDGLEPKKMAYYQEKMCEKQANYFKFKNEYMEGMYASKVDTDSHLLEKYELKVANKNIFINIFNTSWISQRKEKPGEIFIPKAVYDKKLGKSNGLNITIYHHPSNWMHPDDKIYFDKEVRSQSDMLFVGHEHFGREEHVITSQAEYDLEYGEVLQDLDDENNSAFKMHYIDDDGNIISYTYRWERKRGYYECIRLSDRKLGENISQSISFLPGYKEWLNSLDMQISHPNKRKVNLNDVFIFPNVEEYTGYGDFAENTKDRVTIRGEFLLKYILDNKLIEFSGGPKVGKTALAKMITQEFAKQEIHSLIVDCKKRGPLSVKNMEKIENSCIYEAYGKEKVEVYRQLPTNQKMIIIDNIEIIKSEKERREIIDYLTNFYDYIISFTGMSYEIAMLRDTIHQKSEPKIKYCVIKELGHKQRNWLYKKWYMLDEGDGAIVIEEIDKKVKKATDTINTLKGNGYMPCIAPNIIIILQQLEFQADKNQDRSNYGYMYEFLITKSILDMKKNCASISDDIATGILISVAQFMLEKHRRTIEEYEFTEIVNDYNERYITEASKDIYLNEYVKVDLIEFENDEIKFKYPYIHYYFTAKYLSNHISDQFVKDTVHEMASNLQDEECGDIMIFLCHLTKEQYIFNSVLECSKKLLEDEEIFDFGKYKNIKMNFDEFLDTDFQPEDGKEERQEQVLERKDKYEEERSNKKTEVVAKTEDNYDLELQKKMEVLDAAYKSIEVMGQILKNYPGSVNGTIKVDLLKEVHSLGMRALTFTHEILKDELEKCREEVNEIVYKKIHEQSQKQEDAIDEEAVWNYIKTQLSELSIQMDNLFGLMSYSLLRRLANSLGNEDLKPLINHVKYDDILSYRLMKWSIYLNEFGILQGDAVIAYYESLLKNKNIFAAKLLKLFVYEYYYFFGSKDIRMKQKIWSKFRFNKKQANRVLLSQLEK